MKQIYDVIIVGAGPAGLAAAIYTGRARQNTLILEKGIPGGQILLSDYVENYPGFPEGVAPFQLIKSFKEQAERFGANIETDEAMEIRKGSDYWHILSSRNEYIARAVIIATGAGFRKLGVNGEAELTGRGVSYCAVCDGAFFKDKIVAVMGGGNLALTEALFLTRFARIVKIIHRRDKFRGEKILQERVFKNDKIEVIWDSVIEKIIGEGKLESVILKDVKNNTLSELNLDGLFISIGTDANSSLVKGFVDINEWGQIKVSKTMATSQPSIYAAGDVTDACPQQIATAVGTGVAAALAVDNYLGR